VNLVTFQNPEFLWLLAVLPLLLLLRGRAGRAAAVQFSSIAVAKELGATARSRAGWVLFALRALGLAAFSVALARPQIPLAQTEQVEASGIDIVLVLDLSYSMAAVDMSVSESHLLTRVDAAKEVLTDFIKRRPNDRIGMVVFAKSAYLVSPITLDHDWLQQNLNRLHLTSIDGGSTAIGSGLAMAANRLRDLESKSKVVILLTDGDNNSGVISPLTAAEAASAYKVKVYTIGIGTENSAMPLLGDNGQLQYDRNGHVIFATDMFGRRVPVDGIDSDDLQKIADKTGGQFFRATDQNQLRKIYDEIDRQEKSPARLRHFSTYAEVFYWPALLGLGLLGLEQTLAHTRLRRLP
jgi:Ca-activated chloride channel family protein